MVISCLLFPQAYLPAPQTFLFPGESPSLSFLPHGTDLPPPVPVFLACLPLDLKLCLGISQGSCCPSGPSACSHRCPPRFQHQGSPQSAGALQCLSWLHTCFLPDFRPQLSGRVLVRVPAWEALITSRSGIWELVPERPSAGHDA